jgi:hypothetical protein
MNNVKTIAKNRKYVILCTKYKSVFPGALLFWGSLTTDNEKRSFSAYTSDIDSCEHYSLDDLIASHVSFDVYDPKIHKDFQLDIVPLENIIITQEDVCHLPGFKEMHMIYRP